MTTFTIELPATLDVASRGQSVQLDLAKLPADLIARAALHGFTQKIADAAAGAGKFAEANNMATPEAGAILMAKVVTNLEAGTWGIERTGGSGFDTLTKMCHTIARETLHAKLAAENKPYKTFTDKSPDEQIAILAKIIAGDESIEKRAKARLAEKTKLADAIDLSDLGL